MAEPIVIALDAMGGDRGPEVVVGGAALSIIRHPETRFRFYGDEKCVRPLAEAQAALAGKYEIIHTDVAIAHGRQAEPGADARPRQVQHVAGDRGGEERRGQHAVVSAGNTGALMAMAKVCLKMIPGVERPAMSAIWPTVAAECLVLDLGANVEASARPAGRIRADGRGDGAQALFDVERAKVGLLNIGVEEVKGLEAIKDAHALLRAATCRSTTSASSRATSIGHGAADVVVTDGFTGNIALKTAEGTARQIAVYLRQAMSRTLIVARSAACWRRARSRCCSDKMDPRRLNGGVFLGLDGLVIKSHGGTDALGFASAIDLGDDLARDRLDRATSRAICRHSRKAASQRR